MHEIIFVNGQNTASKLSRLYKEGRVRRLYSGIYSSDLRSPVNSIIRQNWLAVVSYIVPKAILSFRTAHDLRLIPYSNDASIVFVTSTYAKTINLPGLIIKVIKGDNEHYTEQILPSLARSNEARMLLENLTIVRGSRYNGIKTVGVEGVELYLAKCLRNRNEIALNTILDEAKEIYKALDFKKEFDVLSQIISALLVTNTDTFSLTTKFANALVKKEPFDSARINLFANLSLYLQRNTFINRDYKYNLNSFKNIAFFESYFSNYIEGTKFIIDEAEQIVFSNKLINNRHADSHDVLAHYRISNDITGNSITPNSQNEFLELIQSRHAALMYERPDIDPGQFKKRRNQAGSTVFVDPAEVVGTLTHAFDLYALLEDGFKKALFMHYILTEIHPFNDGNGRLSRIMMNAELVKVNEFKIIIPTVYRDCYLTALRSISRDQNFTTYCKMMDVAQAYTAIIPWDNYLEARHKIELDHANLETEDGLTQFNKVIRTLKLSNLESN